MGERDQDGDGACWSALAADHGTLLAASSVNGREQTSKVLSRSPVVSRLDGDTANRDAGCTAGGPREVRLGIGNTHGVFPAIDRVLDDE